jgi:DivIVA domain-containing protein
MTIEAEQFPRSTARPFDVAGATFPLIRRGYDPSQVTWFLQGVAEDVADHERRIGELETALAEANEELRTINRIDEVTVAHFLGEESARMLTTARDTASDLAARAETRAAAAIAEAESHATSVRHEADTDTRRQRKETDAACAAALAEAEEKAAKIVREAEAQRHQILADLGRRRELAGNQFRELIAGRDSLVRALTSVETTARSLTADLSEFGLVPANFVSLEEIVQEIPQVELSVVPAIMRTTTVSMRS